MARWSKARMPKHWLTALEKRVRTAWDMMEAFSDEAERRRILEAMVWARGHFCPFCGSLSSAPIAGRDVGKKARPGLCQCAEPEYRGRFTVTTRTPLHSTKLKLSALLRAIWRSPQTDKGMSSPPLAELAGVTRTTAWWMSQMIRLLMAPGEDLLEGHIEADEVMVGGKRRKDPSDAVARRNKQGHTTKRPVPVTIQRPQTLELRASPGRAVARPLMGVSAAALQQVISTVVAATATLMTDQHGGFAVVGRSYADHQSVNHGQFEYVRGDVHVNSAEGFNDRVRRTVPGVFHHIGQQHSERYLDEVAFRWNQRICTGMAIRKSRSGKVRARARYDRRPSKSHARPPNSRTAVSGM